MALLEPIHERALTTARRLSRSATDGDDLYQEVVVRAFEMLHTLRLESRFRSWFYAMLLNRHRTRQRRAFWRRLVPWEEAFPPGKEPKGDLGDGWAQRDPGVGRVARALASLGAEQREAIVLFELDGYSIEEVAEMQGASVPAVKSRLVRGRERLRRWYERSGWLGRDVVTASGGEERHPRLRRPVTVTSSRSGSSTGRGTGAIP
ncbi:MAG TPA: RNA polymerase sigma factor [Candidatus Eisenbacteria bacterium]|jgi:RNA polymerase sigma-70 factor (ECF subfamily)